MGRGSSCVLDYSACNLLDQYRLCKMLDDVLS
jgi:hypothetical protein